MYFKIYLRLVPFQLILFIFSLLILLYQSFVFKNLDLFTFFIILFISLSPMIFNELSKGPKALLPFYTTYVTLFFPIGLCIYIFTYENTFFSSYVYSIIIFLFLFLFLIWNLYYFFTDISKSKPGSVFVINFLNS